jgi:hypothetical protein
VERTIWRSVDMALVGWVHFQKVDPLPYFGGSFERTFKYPNFFPVKSINLLIIYLYLKWDMIT